MKIDLTKTGFDMIYEPWQSDLVVYLLTNDVEVTNAEAHTYLRSLDFKISRASVVGFLARLAKDGIVYVRTEEGKGGEHPVYTAKPRAVRGYGGNKKNMTVKAFWIKVADEVIDVMSDIGIELNYFPEARK